MAGPAWIVVPTYNEAENLGPLVAALREAVPEARVLVVDDGSPDGTGELADAIAARDGAVEALHRPRKAGLGLAYVSGFARALAAGAGYVVEMDADLSHDPRDVPRRLPLRPDGARRRHPRPDRRLQVLPRRGAHGDRLRDRALAGLRVPGR